MPEPAPDDELQRVHVPSLPGSAVRSAPGRRRTTSAHGLGTDDNPIFDGMHEASALVCGGSLAAAPGDRRGPGRPRGQHRRRAAPRDAPTAPSGFCVYNDCAVAISWLLDHGFERIAYVDVDVHHGDGVQAAFYDDPRVLTISLHQHPLTLWPGTGWPAEYGEGEARGHGGQRAAAARHRATPGWLRAFHAVVPSLLAAFRPQLLVTQCGADTHREDPLADLRLSVDGHRDDLPRAARAGRPTLPRGAGSPSAAAGTGCSGWCRGRGRTCSPPCSTATSTRAGRCPPGWIALRRRGSPGGRCRRDDDRRRRRGARAVDRRAADRVDPAVLDTRRAVFPLHGLDPDDPRD